MGANSPNQAFQLCGILLRINTKLFFSFIKSNEQTTHSILMLINHRNTYWLFNETASLINSDPVLSPHCYFELEMRQQKYNSFIWDQK